MQEPQEKTSVRVGCAEESAMLIRSASGALPLGNGGYSAYERCDLRGQFVHRWLLGVWERVLGGRS